MQALEVINKGQGEDWIDSHQTMKNKLLEDIQNQKEFLEWTFRTIEKISHDEDFLFIKALDDMISDIGLPLILQLNSANYTKIFIEKSKKSQEYEILIRNILKKCVEEIVFFDVNDPCIEYIVTCARAINIKIDLGKNKKKMKDLNNDIYRELLYFLKKHKLKQLIDENLYVGLCQKISRNRDSIPKCWMELYETILKQIPIESISEAPSKKIEDDYKSIHIIISYSLTDLEHNEILTKILLAAGIQFFKGILDENCPSKVFHEFNITKVFLNFKEHKNAETLFEELQKPQVFFEYKNEKIPIKAYIQSDQYKKAHLRKLNKKRSLSKGKAK